MQAREKAERDAAAKRDAEALADKKYRVGRLDAVHKLFDLDGGGFVSKAELQELGQASHPLTLALTLTLTQELRQAERLLISIQGATA